MNITYMHGLIGGALIGLAAVILFWCNGRIMGVSGILARLMGSVLCKPIKFNEEWWRLAFISGLIMGGFVYSKINPVEMTITASPMTLIIAGALVGFGTVLGNGCTSGHGICGVARLSKRSLVATLVFMAFGVLTVWLKHVWGG